MLPEMPNVREDCEGGEMKQGTTLTLDEVTGLIKTLNGQEAKYEAAPLVYGRGRPEQVYLCGKCKRAIEYDFIFCPRCAYKVLW